MTSCFGYYTVNTVRGTLVNGSYVDLSLVGFCSFLVRTVKC